MRSGLYPRMSNHGAECPQLTPSPSQDGAALSHRMMAMMMTINAYGCMPLNGLIKWTFLK